MNDVAAYSKRWHHDRACGRTRTTPGGPVRVHVQALIDAGWSQRAIADAAGLGSSTVHNVMTTANRVKNATAHALLGVSESDILTRSNPLGFVRRVGAKRRVQALLAIGWRHADITAAMIAADVGCRVHAQLVLSQRGAWINRATHDAVEAAYAELSMRPGPSSRTRSRATAAGFAPPLAWDDDAIDDPNAKPANDAEPDGELDEVAVERIMAGTLHVPHHSQSAERREAIRRLAARGFTDREIGDRVGLTGDAVCATRLRYDIPAGLAAA